ncbi:MAG: sugar transferase [Clostridia bacterium]|nr:sugar transferase [Clostridia bacterium]
MLLREKLQYIMLFLMDAIALTFSCVAAFFPYRYLIYDHAFLNDADLNNSIFQLAAVFLILFVLFVPNKNINRQSLDVMFRRSFLLNLLGFGMLVTVMTICRNDFVVNHIVFLILGTFVNIFATAFGHYAVRSILVNRIPRAKMATLVGVVTTKGRSVPFIESLKKDWTRNIVGVALIDYEYDQEGIKIRSKSPEEEATTPPMTEICGVPIKANFFEFIEWIKREAIDEVFIDIPYYRGEQLHRFLTELESMGIVIHLNVPMIDKLSESKNLHLQRDYLYVNDKPMITFAVRRYHINLLALKRILDIVLGLIGSIISLPIILLTAFPLLIESPGPLIFRQKRVGKNGRIFYMYKLRSMYPDAEARKAALMKENEMKGLMFKMENDPRITKVGKIIRKLSIDELPQFWNILRGDMSLVGTRPPTLDEYEQYESHHKRRLSLKPGLTGLWQVSGRNTIDDFEEVVKLDLQYIDNWSIWEDLRIILKTVYVVIARKGSK